MRRGALLAATVIACLQASPVFAAASPVQCINAPVQSLTGIDIAKVRTAWLGWYNRVRKLNGLPLYVYSQALDATATNWSDYAVKRGTIDHKRYAGSPYYDYAAIGKWFAGKGLTFDKVHGATYTENVGWGYFDCRVYDCTQALIGAIRSTFRFYVSERGKKSHAHYASIVDPGFTEIGLGIALDPAHKRYYLTVHYAARIVSQSLPACRES